MSGLPRDSQRSKLYRSELRQGERFETVAEMQDYVDKLIGSAWFKRRWPKLQCITIHSGARNRRATCSFGLNPTIKMPRWARIESILLHEVAHACMNDERWRTRTRYAAHGPEFAAVYLTLIRRQMGDEAWRAQRELFVLGRVRHRRPSKTKRTLTPEQRAAATERLAAAREQRGRA